MERITLVDNSRQTGMQQELRMRDNETHMVIGCGGIGFWLALLLCMMGESRFILMDGDKIDNSNLNRLPTPQTWLGLNKAVALRKMIRLLRPDCIVTVLGTHITPDTLNIIEQFFNRRNDHYFQRIEHLTVWDTTDNAEIQKKIHNTVKGIRRGADKVVYRKLGYEGFKVANYEHYSVWTPEGYTTGYRTTQANAVSSVLSAGIGLFSRYLTDQDVNVDLKKLILKGGFNGTPEPRVERVVSRQRTRRRQRV